MDTAKGKLLFQVQFWGLIGPLVALVTMLVIFIKSPPQAIYLSVATILGLLASLKWKIRGFAISLGFIILFYLYQFSEINPNEHLWYVGINLSIVIGFIIAALSFNEVEQLLHPLDDNIHVTDSNASIASEETDILKFKLEENIVSLKRVKQDLLVKTKQINSYESLVENVKSEAIKTNTQHEKLLEEFLQKQLALSFAEEKLNDAHEQINTLSENSISLSNFYEKLNEKTQEIFSLRETLAELNSELSQVKNQMDRVRKEKPLSDDENIQDLKSTNELLSRERGRLETMLFRTQIDLHQKTQDLLHLPELQSELESLKQDKELLKQEISNLQITLESFEKELSEDDKENVKFDELQASSAILKSTLDEKNEALNVQSKKLENYEIELRELENSFLSETKRNETLELSYTNLKETISEKLAIYEKEIQGIEDLLSKEAKQKEELETCLKELKEVTANQGKELQEKVNQLKIYEAKVLETLYFLASESEQSNALKNIIESLKEEALKKTNQLAVLEAKALETEKLLANESEQSNTLKSLNDSFKDETSEKAEELSKKTNQLAEYEAKVLETEKLLASESEKNNALKSLIVSLKEETSVQREELSKKTNQLAEYEAKVLETEQLLSAEFAFKGEIEATLMSYKEQISETKIELLNKTYQLSNFESKARDIAEQLAIYETKNKDTIKLLNKEILEKEEMKKSCAKLEQAVEAIQLEENESQNIKELTFNFKKIEGKYNQLREQFELKTEVLNETRKELFKTEEQLLQLKLEYDEIQVYHLNDAAASMENHILKMIQESEEKIHEMQSEVDALQAIVTSLTHQ